MSRIPSLHDALNCSYKDAVAAIAEDMTVLMHGAGDVYPEQVDPAAVQLLSVLTVQHMSRLVDAAIDAREMLLDHQKLLYQRRRHRKSRMSSTSSTATSTPSILRPDPPLPPPIFRRKRFPSVPRPPDENQNVPNNKTNEDDNGRNSNKDSWGDTVKRKRLNGEKVEYWDDPLPQPKIRNRGSAVAMNDTTSTTTTPVHPIDEWTGVAGVDLFERRCRAAYVRGTAAITTQSFLFPVCHDVYTYGRIREIQATKRATFGDILEDTVLTELIRVEGRRHQKKNKRNHRNRSLSMDKTNNGPHTSDLNDDDFDDDDEDDANSADAEVPNPNDEGPLWPGLEGLLPVYRTTIQDCTTPSISDSF